MRPTRLSRSPHVILYVLEVSHDVGSVGSTAAGVTANGSQLPWFRSSGRRPLEMVDAGIVPQQLSPTSESAFLRALGSFDGTRVQNGTNGCFYEVVSGRLYR